MGAKGNTLGNHAHLGAPIWHQVQQLNPLKKHSMDNMVKNVEALLRGDVNPLYNGHRAESVNFPPNQRYQILLKLAIAANHCYNLEEKSTIYKGSKEKVLALPISNKKDKTVQITSGHLRLL